MNKKIVIDTTTNDYPKFLEKESFNENAWILCSIEISKHKRYTGRITNMSSTGKYTVELLKEIIL